MLQHGLAGCSTEIRNLAQPSKKDKITKSDRRSNAVDTSTCKLLRSKLQLVIALDVCVYNCGYAYSKTCKYFNSNCDQTVRNKVF
jgi:hypothetical protein